MCLRPAPSMKSVLVSHPQTKFDAQMVATGLSAVGRLGAFFTGVAAVPGSKCAQGLSCTSRLMPQLANRLVRGVKHSQLHSLAAVEISARTLGQVSRQISTWLPSAPDCTFTAHDAMVALLPWPKSIDGIYAYEDAALRTFGRAARKSLPRVYDLPTPHYTTVERVRRAESLRWPGAVGSRPPVEPRWKKRRKDRELALATHVSVASPFTRESLEAINGKLPIRVTPYGFPTDVFPCKDSAADGPFTVLAVGNHNLRKGTPYLLEAWKHAGLKDARLRLIGPMKLTAQFLELYRGLFEHVPHLPKTQLVAEYQAADVVAFPTICDGFGLVIQEAMCCGTPVITTRCGGGPACIDHGHNGWIIPERNVDALVSQLRAAADDRQATFKTGQAARARAEQYTWQEAGAAFATFLAEI